MGLEYGSDTEEAMEMGNEGAVIELETDHRKTFEIAKHAMVGRIISEKPLNKKTVREMVQKSWGHPKGLHIIDLNTNTYLFNFSEASTPRKIMEDAPWNILGSLLCLHRWVPEFSIHEVDYSFSPFWIQMHGVPLEGMSMANATKMAAMVGEIKEIEDPVVGNKLVRGFLRAKVVVNITKPLVTGFWIPRKDMPKTWVWIHYEKLQDYCYNCGRLGHGKKDCKIDMKMALWNPKRPRYGPGLGVPPLKPVSEIIAGMSMQKEDGGAWHALPRESSKEASTVWKVGDRYKLGKEGKQSDEGEAPGTAMEMAAKISGKDCATFDPSQIEKGLEERGGTVSHVEVGMMESGMEVETDSRAKGIMSSGLAVGPSEAVTRIDLKERMIRPGLGPGKLQDLDLEKEDIGLANPVIILDVLSPPMPCKVGSGPDGPCSLDMEMGPEKIAKCREAIKRGRDKHVTYDGLDQGNHPTNLEMVIWKPREKFKKKSQAQYIVEFPDEKEEGNSLENATGAGGSGMLRMGTEERELLKIFKESLLIKRQREENEDMTGFVQMGKRANLGNMLKLTSKEQDGVNEEENANDAGVAGFVLPHEAP